MSIPTGSSLTLTAKLQCKADCFNGLVPDIDSVVVHDKQWPPEWTRNGSMASRTYRGVSP